MHPRRSLIDHMRQVLPGLSKSQRRVAETVLSDIDAATRVTTKELSERAGVSEPTIVRFARQMGSEGFTDFKIRLSQDFATGRMFTLSDPAVLPHDPVMIANQVYEATAQALAYSFAQRAPETLARAAAAIDAAQRVFCLGVGGSSANVAAEAANRLYRFDVHASALIDPYAQTVAAALCGPKDALLIVSVTGKPASLLSSARLAQAQGAAVIAITRPDSPLAQASTIVVGLAIPDHDRRFEIPNRSRYGQLYMLDCIASLVAARRLKTAAPKLQRAHRALLELNGPTEEQPIGD